MRTAVVLLYCQRIGMFQKIRSSNIHKKTLLFNKIENIFTQLFYIIVQLRKRKDYIMKVFLGGRFNCYSAVLTRI